MSCEQHQWGEWKAKTPVKASRSELDATIKRNKADASCQVLSVQLHVKGHVMGHIRVGVRKAHPHLGHHRSWCKSAGFPLATHCAALMSGLSKEHACSIHPVSMNQRCFPSPPPSHCTCKWVHTIWIWDWCGGQSERLAGRSPAASAQHRCHHLSKLTWPRQASVSPENNTAMS